MANLQLAMRLISAEAEVPGDRLRNGRLQNDQEWARVHRAIEVQWRRPHLYRRYPPINIFELRAKCRHCTKQHGIEDGPSRLPATHVGQW